MTISLTQMKSKANALIVSAAGSPAAGKEVFYRSLLTTDPEAGPYYEHTNKEYNDPVEIIAWVIIDPDDPKYESMRLELLRIGETTDIGALFYVSEMENEAKSLDFTPEQRDGRILHAGLTYDILLIKPSAHVHGEPTYWRIATAKGALR